MNMCAWIGGGMNETIFLGLVQIYTLRVWILHAHFPFILHSSLSLDRPSYLCFSFSIFEFSQFQEYVLPNKKQSTPTFYQEYVLQGSTC